MTLEEKTKSFLSAISGYGSGDGYGYGDGDGYGSGDGSGSGTSDGSGDGYCFGYGYGYGYGDGYGSGHGDGYGSGHGDGYGIKNINGESVYRIDGVNTLVRSVRGNTAHGAIVNSDLTLTPCYIVKQDNVFAHGETLRKAMEGPDPQLRSLMCAKWKTMWSCENNQDVGLEAATH